jgi:hypothetical protein
MARYLIEVSHEDDFDACVKAASLLLSTGSHFLTNADWGCSDGEHKAWVIVDVDSREEALSILPPSCRPTAKIIRLNRFVLDDFDKIFYKHQKPLKEPDSENKIQ